MTVVKKGAAEKTQVGNFPKLSEMRDQAIAAGAKIYICEQSTQILGMARGDFIEEGQVVDALTLNDLAIGLAHEEAHGSMIATLGRTNSMDEVPGIVDAARETVKHLRAITPL